MPAQRLESATVNLRRYDVAGQDSEGSAEFVRHVGLVHEQRGSFNAKKHTLALVDMGPPLARGTEENSIHSVGTVPLTLAEIQQISVLVDELFSEYEAQKMRARSQYVIVPHATEERAKDGTVKCRRFNCAGFVIEAYREAGIDLVNTALEQLPPVSLETLLLAFPDQEDFLRNPKMRKRFGLEGDGPWPVVLAGYVLNALNRLEETIRTEPYAPKSGDEYFVTRRVQSVHPPQ